MKKFLIALGFLIPFTAQSQDGFYASGLLGINSTTMDFKEKDFIYFNETKINLSFDSEISFGFRFGLLFNDHISAGVYLQRYTGKTSLRSKSITHDSNIPMWSCTSPCEIVNTRHDYNVTFNNFLAELTYYINEVDENGLWISGLLGVTQIKTSISKKDNYNGNLVDENSGETSFGVSLGYHFIVAPNFSISPQMSFIHIGASRADFNQFSGLINVTLWL